MKLARLQVDELAAPVLALLRDGAFYDVAVLEEQWRLRAPSQGVGSFHARVVASRLSGLDQLDARLAAGQRPTEARLLAEDFMPLPPCSRERGGLLQLSPLNELERPQVERRDRRALLGDGHPVLYPPGCAEPVAEVGLAALLADDLDNASRRQARAALLGVSPMIDWGNGVDWSTPRWAPQPPTQLGPALLTGPSMRAAFKHALIVRSTSGEVSLPLGFDVAARLAELSTKVPLYAGDVVGLGCLPGGQFRWTFGAALSVRLRGTPVLRGWPLPARP